MAKDINEVLLMGNLTQDPELKYTPQGTPVCNFGLATNRRWKNDAGEDQSEATFHNIVVWNKLAEVCSQYLKKGSRALLRGRIVNRSWEKEDGTKAYRTEVVIHDLNMLDTKKSAEGSEAAANTEAATPAPAAKPEPVQETMEAELD